MNKTIFTCFLEELGIKHTKSYAKKIFVEHPYKYTLYGISNLLSLYHIPNQGIKVTNKDLNQLNPPFIAHTGHDFIIVNKIDADISYTWNGKKLSVPFEKFINTWTGIVLVANPNEKSKEPNYKKHKLMTFFNLTKYWIILLAILSNIVAYLCQNDIIEGSKTTLLLFTNMFGVYIGGLLLSKQLKVESAYADKICSLFHQKDCNNVLESKGAKILGNFSWSEIGIGYFISNLAILIFYPRLVNYSAFINMIILPYAIWSVWYQYKIVKQWCALCLIVQVAIWSLFILNILGGNFFLIKLDLIDIFKVLSTYIIAILSINLFSISFSSMRKKINELEEMRGLKAKDEVFEALVKRQPHYKVDKEVSTLLFGNVNSDTLITIFSNPHCKPCELLHQKIDHVLEMAGDKICIQYIYTSFNDDLLSSNRFLIAAYFHNTPKETLNIYNKWYGKEKYHADAYFNKFGYQLYDKKINNEIEQHKKWAEETGITSTPTVLINGYLLPDAYDIDDIIYFTDIKIN